MPSMQEKLYEIIRDFPNEDILINEVENHWIEIGKGKIAVSYRGNESR